MQTFTPQRKLPTRRAQAAKTESAALALTAQLLAGIKARSFDSPLLSPRQANQAGLRARCWPDLALFTQVTCTRTGRERYYFDRHHGSALGTTWHGLETLHDNAGRTWTRLFSAVVDDFGNLVEVQG